MGLFFATDDTVLHGFLYNRAKPWQAFFIHFLLTSTSLRKAYFVGLPSFKRAFTIRNSRYTVNQCNER